MALFSKMSTYWQYSVALLLQQTEYPKDKVILRVGEMSKGLYFITSGTVEVIQVRKRRLCSTAHPSSQVKKMRVRHSGKPKTRTDHSSKSSASGLSGGHTPTENVVYKTEKRILTTLEAGEYFGESGVLTFAKRGKGGHSQVLENFTVLAGTNVEALMLRSKHYNVINIQVLEMLQANTDARYVWRIHRKAEAHRGRAVLRAAKKEIQKEAGR
ncbi:unnamed protein product, partial [Discosporangium mesarthrocarpum]